MAVKNSLTGKAYSVRDWTWEEAPRLRKNYLRLKFDVFVDELGFSGVPCRHGLAEPDAFDYVGRFVTVETSTGQTIAIGRLNLAHDAVQLPTAGAFPEFTADALVRLHPPLRIAAVTNVALLPSYRGICVNPICEQHAHPRVSDLLMQRIIELAVQARVDALVLLTRPGSRAEGLFSRFGFQRSEKRYRYEKLGLEANRWLAHTEAAAIAADRIFNPGSVLADASPAHDDTERARYIAEVLRDLWSAPIAAD